MMTRRTGAPKLAIALVVASILGVATEDAVAARSSMEWPLPLVVAADESGDAYLLLAIPAAVLESQNRIEEAVLTLHSALGALPGCLAFLPFISETDNLDGEVFPAAGSAARLSRSSCKAVGEVDRDQHQLLVRHVLRDAQLGGANWNGILVGQLAPDGRCRRLPAASIASLESSPEGWRVRVTVWSARVHDEEE